MSAQFLSVTMSVFGWAQIILCFKAKKRWLRFLPLTLSVCIELLCWVVYFLSKLLMLEDSLGYPAAMLGCILWLWVVMALVGWGFYGIVKTVQKWFR